MTHVDFSVLCGIPSCERPLSRKDVGILLWRFLPTTNPDQTRMGRFGTANAEYETEAVGKRLDDSKTRVRRRRFKVRRIDALASQITVALVSFSNGKINAESTAAALFTSR